MKDLLKHFFDKIDAMQFFVGLMVMGIFLMLIYALIHTTIPEANKDMVNHAIGLVEGAVIMVVGYYYGSSKGSAKKDDALKAKDDIIAANTATLTPSPGQTIDATLEKSPKPD